MKIMKLMQLHEIQRAQYREMRYLDHLSEEELRQRFQDVFCNLTRITENCKLGMLPIDEIGKHWMRLWVDVLEEFRL